MIVFFPITKNIPYYIIYSNTIVVLDGAKVVIYIYLSEENSKKMNNYIIRYGDTKLYNPLCLRNPPKKITPAKPLRLLR